MLQLGELSAAAQAALEQVAERYASLVCAAVEDVLSLHVDKQVSALPEEAFQEHLLSICAFGYFQGEAKNVPSKSGTRNSAADLCNLLRTTLSAAVSDLPKNNQNVLEGLLTGFRLRSEVVLALSVVITCTHRSMSNLLLIHPLCKPAATTSRPSPQEAPAPASPNTGSEDELTTLLFGNVLDSDKAHPTKRVSPSRDPSLRTAFTIAKFDALCEGCLDESTAFVGILGGLFAKNKGGAPSPAEEDTFRSLATTVNDLMMTEAMLTLLRCVDIGVDTTGNPSQMASNPLGYVYSSMSHANEIEFQSVFRFLRLAACDPLYGLEMHCSPAPVAWSIAFPPAVETAVASTVAKVALAGKQVAHIVSPAIFDARRYLDRLLLESVSTSVSFALSSQVGINAVTFQSFSPWALGYLQSWLLEEAINPLPPLSAPATANLTSSLSLLRGGLLVATRLLASQLSTADADTMSGSLLGAVTTQPHLLLAEGGLANLSLEHRTAIANICQVHMDRCQSRDSKGSSDASVPPHLVNSTVAKFLEIEGDIYLNRCQRSRIPKCPLPIVESLLDFPTSGGSSASWMPPRIPQKVTASPFDDPVAVTFTSQVLQCFKDACAGYVQLTTTSSSKGIGGTLQKLVRTKQERQASTISEADRVKSQVMRLLDFLTHLTTAPYSPVHMNTLGELFLMLASVSKGYIDIKWLLCKTIVACLSHVVGHRGFACVTDSSHRMFEQLYASHIRDWCSKERYLHFALPCAAVVVTLLGRQGFVVESPKLFSSLVRTTADSSRTSVFQTGSDATTTPGVAGKPSQSTLSNSTTQHPQIHRILAAVEAAFAPTMNPLGTLPTLDSIHVDLKGPPERSLEMARPTLIDAMSHVVGFYLTFLLHPLHPNPAPNQERNLLENNLKTMLLQVKEGPVQALRKGGAFSNGVGPAVPRIYTGMVTSASNVYRSTVAALARFLLVVCIHRPVQFGIPLLLDILPHNDPATVPTESTLSSATALAVVVDCLFNTAPHHPGIVGHYHSCQLETAMSTLFTLDGFVFHKLPEDEGGISQKLLVSNEIAQPSIVPLTRSSFYCIVAKKCGAGPMCLRLPHSGSSSFAALFDWEESVVALERYRHCVPFTRPGHVGGVTGPPQLGAPSTINTSQSSLSELCVHTKHWWSIEQGGCPTRALILAKLEAIRALGPAAANEAKCPIVAQLLPHGVLSGHQGADQPTITVFASAPPIPLTEICMMVLSGMSFSAFVAETTALNVLGALSEVPSGQIAALSYSLSTEQPELEKPNSLSVPFLNTSLAHYLGPAAFTGRRPVGHATCECVVEAVVSYLDATVVRQVLSSICRGTPITEQYVRQSLCGVLGSCFLASVSLVPSTTPPPLPPFVALYSRLTSSLLTQLTYLDREVVTTEVHPSNAFHALFSPLVTPVEARPGTFPSTRNAPNCGFSLKGKLRFVDRGSTETIDTCGALIEAVSDFASPTNYVPSPRDTVLQTMLMTTGVIASWLVPQLLLHTPLEGDTTPLFAKPTLTSLQTPTGRDEDAASNDSFSFPQDHDLETAATTSTHSQEFFASGTRSSLALEDHHLASFLQTNVNAKSSIPPLLLRMLFHRSQPVRTATASSILKKMLHWNDYYDRNKRLAPPSNTADITNATKTDVTKFSNVVAAMVARCLDLSSELRVLGESSCGSSSFDNSYSERRASLPAGITPTNMCVEEELRLILDDIQCRWASRWQSPLAQVRFGVRGPYFSSCSAQLPSKVPERIAPQATPNSFLQPQWMWSHFTDNLGPWVVAKLCDYALWIQYNGATGSLSQTGISQTSSESRSTSPTNNDERLSSPSAANAPTSLDDTLRLGGTSTTKASPPSWPPIVDTSASALLRNTIAVIQVCLGELTREGSSRGCSALLSQAYPPCTLALVSQEFAAGDGESPHTDKNSPRVEAAWDLPSARTDHVRNSSGGTLPSARGGPSGGSSLLRVFATVGWWGAEQSMKTAGSVGDAVAMNTLLRGMSGILGCVLPSSQNKPGGAGGWVPGSFVDLLESTSLILLAHGDCSVRACAFGIVESAERIQSAVAIRHEELNEFLDNAVLEHEIVCQGGNLIEKAIREITEWRARSVRTGQVSLGSATFRGVGSPSSAILTGRPLKRPAPLQPMEVSSTLLDDRPSSPVESSESTTADEPLRTPLKSQDGRLMHGTVSPIFRSHLSSPATDSMALPKTKGVPKLNLGTVQPSPATPPPSRQQSDFHAHTPQQLRDVSASVACAMFDVRSCLIGSFQRRGGGHMVPLLESLRSFAWAALERAEVMTAAGAGAGCLWGLSHINPDAEHPVRVSQASIAKLKRLGTTSFGDPIRIDEFDADLLQIVRKEQNSSPCPIEAFREVLVCTSHPLTVLMSLLTLALPSLSPLLPGTLSRACFLVTAPAASASLIPSNTPSTLATARWASWWGRQRHHAFPPLLITNRTTVYAPPLVESRATHSQLANVVALVDKCSMDTWIAHFELLMTVVSRCDIAPHRFGIILGQSAQSPDWALRARILCSSSNSGMLFVGGGRTSTNSSAAVAQPLLWRPFKPTALDGDGGVVPPNSAGTATPPAGVLASALVRYQHLARATVSANVDAFEFRPSIPTGSSGVLTEILLTTIPTLFRRFHDTQDIFEAVVFLFDQLLTTMFRESLLEDAPRMQMQLGDLAVESVARICNLLDLQTAIKKDPRKALTTCVAALSMIKFSTHLVCLYSGAQMEGRATTMETFAITSDSVQRHLVKEIDVACDAFRQAVWALRRAASSHTNGGSGGVSFVDPMVSTSRTPTGRTQFGLREGLLGSSRVGGLQSFRARIATARGPSSPTRESTPPLLNAPERNVNHSRSPSHNLSNGADPTSVRARLSVDSLSSPSVTPRGAVKELRGSYSSVNGLGSTAVLGGSTKLLSAAASPGAPSGSTIHLQLVKLLDQFDQLYAAAISDPEAKANKKQGQARKLDRNCGCHPNSLLPPLPPLPSQANVRRAQTPVDWGTPHPDLGLTWEGSMSLRGRCAIITVMGVLSECGLGQTGRALARGSANRKEGDTYIPTFLFGMASSATSTACSTILRERLPEFTDFLSHYVVWLMRIASFHGMQSVIQVASINTPRQQTKTNNRCAGARKIPITKFTSPSFVCRLATHSLCSALALYYYHTALRHMKKSTWTSFTQDYLSNVAQTRKTHTLIIQKLNSATTSPHLPPGQSKSAFGVHDGSSGGVLRIPSVELVAHRFYIPPQLSSVSLAALQTDPLVKEGAPVLMLVLDNLIDCFGDAFNTVVRSRLVKQRQLGRRREPLESISWGPVVAQLTGSTLWFDITEFAGTVVRVAPSFAYLLFAKLSSSVPSPQHMDFCDHPNAAEASATRDHSGTKISYPGTPLSMTTGGDANPTAAPPTGLSPTNNTGMFASPSRSLMFSSVVRAVVAYPVILLGAPTHYLTSTWKQMQSVPTWPSTHPGKVFSSSSMMPTLAFYSLYFVSTGGAVITSPSAQAGRPSSPNSSPTTAPATDEPMEDGYVPCAEFLGVAREFLSVCVSFRGTNLSTAQIQDRIAAASAGDAHKEVALWLAELYSTFVTAHVAPGPSAVDGSHRPQSNFFDQLWVCTVRLLLPTHDFLSPVPVDSNSHQIDINKELPVVAAEGLLAIASCLPAYVTNLGSCTFVRQCLAIAFLFQGGACTQRQKSLVRGMWRSITCNCCPSEEVTTHVTITGPSSSQRPLVKRVKLLATPREQHCCLLLTGTSAFIVPHPHSSHPPTEPQPKGSTSSNIRLSEAESAFVMCTYARLASPHENAHRSYEDALGEFSIRSVDEQIRLSVSEPQSGVWEDSTPPSRSSSQRSMFDGDASIGRPLGETTSPAFDSADVLADSPEFGVLWAYTTATTNAPPSVQEVLGSEGKEASLVAQALGAKRGGERPSTQHQQESFMFDMFKYSIILLRCRGKATQGAPFAHQAGHDAVKFASPLHWAWVRGLAGDTPVAANSLAQAVSANVTQFYTDVLSTTALANTLAAPVQQSRSLLDALPCILSLTSSGAMMDGYAGRHVNYSQLHSSIASGDPSLFNDTCVGLLEPGLHRRFSHALVCATSTATSSQPFLTAIINAEVNLEWGPAHFFSAKAVELFQKLTQRKGGAKLPSPSLRSSLSLIFERHRESATKRRAAQQEQAFKEKNVGESIVGKPRNPQPADEPKNSLAASGCEVSTSGTVRRWVQTSAANHADASISHPLSPGSSLAARRGLAAPSAVQPCWENESGTMKQHPQTNCVSLPFLDDAAVAVESIAGNSLPQSANARSVTTENETWGPTTFDGDDGDERVANTSAEALMTPEDFLRVALETLEELQEEIWGFVAGAVYREVVRPKEERALPATQDLIQFVACTRNNSSGTHLENLPSKLVVAALLNLLQQIGPASPARPQPAGGGHQVVITTPDFRTSSEVASPGGALPANLFSSGSGDYDNSRLREALSTVSFASNQSFIDHYPRKLSSFAALQSTLAVTGGLPDASPSRQACGYSPCDVERCAILFLLEVHLRRLHIAVPPLKLTAKFESPTIATSAGFHFGAAKIHHSKADPSLGLHILSESKLWGAAIVQATLNALAQSRQGSNRAHLFSKFVLGWLRASLQTAISQVVDGIEVVVSDSRRVLPAVSESVQQRIRICAEEIQWLVRAPRLHRMEGWSGGDTVGVAIWPMLNAFMDELVEVVAVAVGKLSKCPSPQMCQLLVTVMECLVTPFFTLLADEPATASLGFSEAALRLLHWSIWRAVFATPSGKDLVLASLELRDVARYPLERWHGDGCLVPADLPAPLVVGLEASAEAMQSLSEARNVLTPSTWALLRSTFNQDNVPSKTYFPWDEGNLLSALDVKEQLVLSPWVDLVSPKKCLDCIESAARVSEVTPDWVTHLVINPLLVAATLPASFVRGAYFLHAVQLLLNLEKNRHSVVPTVAASVEQAHNAIRTVLQQALPRLRREQSAQDNSQPSVVATAAQIAVHLKATSFPTGESSRQGSTAVVRLIRLYQLLRLLPTLSPQTSSNGQVSPPSTSTYVDVFSPQGWLADSEEGPSGGEKTPAKTAPEKFVGLRRLLREDPAGLFPRCTVAISHAAVPFYSDDDYPF